MAKIKTSILFNIVFKISFLTCPATHRSKHIDFSCKFLNYTSVLDIFSVRNVQNVRECVLSIIQFPLPLFFQKCFNIISGRSVQIGKVYRFFMLVNLLLEEAVSMDETKRNLTHLGTQFLSILFQKHPQITKQLPMRFQAFPKYRKRTKKIRFPHYQRIHCTAHVFEKGSDCTFQHIKFFSALLKIHI